MRDLSMVQREPSPGGISGRAESDFAKIVIARTELWQRRLIARRRVDRWNRIPLISVLREFGQRLLADRQFVLRGPRRLFALRLTTHGQIIGALIALGAIGYVAYLQGWMLRYHSSLAAETRRADDLERSYELLDNEMNNLLDQVQELRRNLQSSNEQLESLGRNAQNLQSNLNVADRNLNEVTSARDIALRNGRVLADRVYQLEARLLPRLRAPTGLMSRLEDRTQISIEDIQATIASTGLKPEKLFDIAKVLPGLGGPLLAANGQNVNAEPAFIALERSLTRWLQFQNVLSKLPLAEPTDGRRQSGFGNRVDPVTGKLALHSGLDIDGQVGQPVRVTAAGRVVLAENAGPYGLMVEVEHDFGIRTRYAHLRGVAVRAGDKVSTGTMIGTMGSSGRSTGTHLHYEVIYNDAPIDPAPFLEAGRHVFKEIQSTEIERPRR